MTRIANFGEQEFAAHQQRVKGGPLPRVAVLDILAPDKPRKYRNIPTEVDGITFDSRKEAGQWQKLLLRQGSGQIHGLQRQVPYPLEVNGVLIATYFADMTFYENGVLVVLDVKGYRTKEYRLKALLMLALYGITIRET